MMPIPELLTEALMMKRIKHRRLKSFHGATPDGAVLSLLHRIGADVSKLHRTNFYLYFRSRSSAELVGVELTASGFSVVVDKSAGGYKWLCLASKEMAPQARELSSLRNKFSDLAKKFDGEYDGWEAEMSPEDGNGLSEQLLRGNNHD